MVEETSKISEEDLNEASGGVVGDPGFLRKYKVYNNKTGKHVASFWSKNNALKYDREYNGGRGRVMDEDSPAFARYRDKWDEYNNTQKLHITHDR